MLLSVLITNSEGNILVERFNGVPAEERLHWRSFLVKLGADNLKGVKNEELLVASHKSVYIVYTVLGDVSIYVVGKDEYDEYDELMHNKQTHFHVYFCTHGSRIGRRNVEFGRTYVVRPKGKHQATVVWLHGLGDNGSSMSQLLEGLTLSNIKWICPTAPTRPVSLLGGFECTAWCDVVEISENSPDDLEGLDASAAHIATLLSTEPRDVTLGIGGFSMGAATALYSATCFATGKYGNGSIYPINIRAVVGLSGWLPFSRELRHKVEVSHDALRRAASLPILMCHGDSDDVVPCSYGEKSAHCLMSAGFRHVSFKKYNGVGHYTLPREMDEVRSWLTARLGLDGSRC